MPEQAYTVTVAKDIEDLVPDLRGVGTPYGFDRVSEIGKRIEDGASAGDRSAIEAPIAEYAEYLSRVKIVCQ